MNRMRNESLNLWMIAADRICNIWIQSIIKLFPFLNAFAKLRNATVSFVMFVFLSVRPHGIAGFPLDGFSCYLLSEDFSTIC